MKRYLGEIDITGTDGNPYKDYDRSQLAMLFISKYGQIDGSHHKAWVLDQVARILKGVPVLVSKASWSNGHTEIRIETANLCTEEYWLWLIDMLGEWNEETEEYEYDYDKGIAP